MARPWVEVALIVTVMFTAYFSVFFWSDAPIFSGPFNTVDGSIYPARLVDVLVSVVLIAALSLWLIPGYLHRFQFLKLTLWILFLVAGVSAFEWLCDQIIQELYNLPRGPDEISDKMLQYRRRLNYRFTVLPGNLLVTGLGVLYGLSRDWVNGQRRQRVLELARTRSELETLRAQIQPHFFFNSINNILAIARRTGDEDTGEALHRLTDFMRYTIYDAREERVLLSQELAHIRNYLELVRLRYSDGSRLDFELTYSESATPYTLAPLLLISLVENAVKHGMHPSDGGWIRIAVAIKDRDMDFSILNGRRADQPTQNVGIGLVNLRRRLDLLYPRQYSLNIETMDHQYSARLILKQE